MLCGFYAYGTLPAASRHAQARRVLAVVACWGRVIPGTLGLRAQHARIEAIWVSSRAKRRYVALSQTLPVRRALPQPPEDDKAASADPPGFLRAPATAA